jgi:F subunit of K+-transporting ATPase
MVPMSLLSLGLLLLVAATVVYLLVALVFPERF